MSKDKSKWIANFKGLDMQKSSNSKFWRYKVKIEETPTTFFPIHNASQTI